APEPADPEAKDLWRRMKRLSDPSHNELVARALGAVEAFARDGSAADAARAREAIENLVLTWLDLSPERPGVPYGVRSALLAHGARVARVAREDAAIALHRARSAQPDREAAGVERVVLDALREIGPERAVRSPVTTFVEQRWSRLAGWSSGWM